MSEQLIKDVLNSTTKIFDTAFEYPIEQEILLADYEEQVFKIIKTNVEHTITQKYIANDKLTIDGFFKVTVFYQPPHIARLATVSKKIPFQKQFEISSDAKTNFIIVNGELQYANTRAVNSQRIDIRGVYGIKVCVFSNSNEEVVTAIAGDDICCDNDEINHFYLIGCGQRQFSIEDDLSFSQGFEKIVNITAQNNNMVITSFADKVNLKGEILADIAYMDKENPIVQHLIKTFIYNQVVDVQGTMENSTPQADFKLINFTVTQNPDTKGIRCIVTANMDVKCFAKSSVMCVKNAFSKNYMCSKTEKSIVFDENVVSVHRSFQISIEDTIPDEYAITYCMADLKSLTVETQDGVNCIKSKIVVSAIAQNLQNELECFVKTQDVIFDFGEPINPCNEYILSCDINNIATTIVGNLLKAQISVTVTGFIIIKNTIALIDEFCEELDKPISDEYEALVLYYAKKNEKIFDIAMQYKTDVNSILEENELNGKTIEEDRMIFIPVFRM